VFVVVVSQLDFQLPVNNKYNTVGKFLKLNIKIVERGKIDTSNTQIHERSLSWLDTSNTQIHERSLSWLDTSNTQIHDVRGIKPGK
jgi:hypothetical protein